MMSLNRAATTVDKERSDALSQMNLSKILRAYIAGMIEDTPGYKALLLDKETMRTCSTLYGRSELADQSVVHSERIDSNEGKDHMELKAICFLRPTRENITYLKKELRQPRYQSYHLYFTNIANQMHLQDLAEADSIKEQIQQVQEYYGDFVALDPHHFVIPTIRNDILICPNAAAITGTSATEYELIDRFVQGLSALFLAIRRRPVIRYQAGSDHAYRLADSLYSLTYKQQYQIFDFGSRSTPIVLILDRKDDPVTPLLTQWTYQAMVHELIGIDDNTVRLTSAKVAEQFRELVLDARHDDFFARNMYSNYGDVGLSVKGMVETFQSTSAQHRQVQSLDDMRRFVMEHQDFQRAQGNVSKHVNMMGELSEIVSRRQLMDVSSAEQEVANPATNLTAAASYEEVMRLVRNLQVSDKDKVRLTMLYALRFESDNMRVRALMEYLITAGVKDREPRLYSAVEAVLKWAGSDKRAGDLYANRSILHKVKALAKGLQGVDNVYTQHTPLLCETLTQLQQSTLPVQSYPYMASQQDEAIAWQGMYKRAPPRETIVFIVGGTTYEEAKAVAEWNEKHAEMRVILGGSTVLNSDAFLAGLTAGSAAADGGSHIINMK